MLKIYLPIIWVLLSLILTSCNSNCANSNLNSFNDVLSNGFSRGGPGFAVVVVKDGNRVVRSAHGLADIEKDISLEPTMPFRIGSLAKPFTAVAIMLLSDEGQLSVSDNITKYLPEYPTHGHRITIENLLTHTSGIINYTDLTEFQSNMRNDIYLNELIDLFKSHPLEFEPGSDISYSNSNYILLGAIIERISGESYCSFMRNRLFIPLGMVNTKCEETHPETTEVIGYTRGDKADPISVTQTYAAGALVSTIDDLALFDEAISSGKLLKQETWNRIFTAFPLNNGKSSKTGYGWGIGNVKGYSAVGHKGTINGFSSIMLRIPEKRIFVAVLSNDDRMHLFTKMESWFHDNSPACMAAQLATIALDSEYFGE